MKNNIGSAERIIRTLIGLGLLGAGYFGDLPFWGVITVFVIGAVLIITGTVRFCPIWSVFGVNTSETERSSKD
ncbi:MAG TPA: DUF2892 domain-containing protein [Nitrospiria bacterium]|nr:DUF2892 domain-containing protein [Nitrospiria bacterium]